MSTGKAAAAAMSVSEPKASNFLVREAAAVCNKKEVFIVTDPSEVHCIHSTRGFSHCNEGSNQLMEIYPGHGGHHFKNLAGHCLHHSFKFGACGLHSVIAMDKGSSPGSVLLRFPHAVDKNKCLSWGSKTKKGDYVQCNAEEKQQNFYIVPLALELANLPIEAVEVPAAP